MSDTDTWREITAYDWVTISGRILHAWNGDDADRLASDWGGHGTTMCRTNGYLRIPGALERMSAKRCNRCCTATGMPRGVGSLKNDAECRALVGLGEK